MEIVPPVNVTRFEQLKPGELFVFFDGPAPCYAIKTAKPTDDSKEAMVLLGPSFIHEASESFIVSWQPATVLSFGHDRSLILPTDPTAWFLQGDTRKPVCLAVAGQDVFICTNGGASPHHFYQYFVNVKTGEVIERAFPSIRAYTRTWELVVPRPDMPPLSLLKYPAA